MQTVRALQFPDSDRDTSRPYLEWGDFEPDVRAFVVAQCRSFRRAVDVGAHVGRHSSRLGLVFARVDAFEPQEQVFRALEANLRTLPATAHRVALGRDTHTGFISAHAGKNSAASLIETARKPGTDPVAVRTLDEYGWDDVDLLKISVPRQADAILAGALNTLERSRPVIWLSAADTWTEDVLQTALTLGKFGYRPAGSLNRTMVLTAFEAPPAPAQAPPKVIRDAQLGTRLSWARPDLADLATAAHSDRGEVAQIGDTIVDACVQHYRRSTGSGVLVTASLVAAPACETPLTVRALGGEIALAPEETCGSDLQDVMRAGLRTHYANGSIRVSAPTEALAYFRDLTLTLRTDTGEQVILRQDLKQAAVLDDIAAELPLQLLDTKTRRFAIHLTTEEGHDRAVEFDLAVDPAELTPSMLTCYLNRGGGGNPAVEAFAKSIGARMAYAEDGAQDGAAFVWGVLRGSKDVTDAVQARDGIFYYMDHAYFARGHMRSYRITRNGFEAGPVRRCPPDRIRKLGVEAQPWRRGGRYILVCPPTDYFMQAHNCPSWLEDTLAALKRQTDREIVVRLKPKPGEAITPLAEAMAGAHALVTHSSNVAVEAAVAGTPVFVAPTSAAAPVGRTDLSLIESPVYPDRDMWLSHLAYSQFSLEEIKYGAAWRMLLEGERREFA